MKVIIAYTAADAKKVDRVLTELGLVGDASVVVIDARSDNKPSASVFSWRKKPDNQRAAPLRAWKGPSRGADHLWESWAARSLHCRSGLPVSLSTMRASPPEHLWRKVFRRYETSPPWRSSSKSEPLR
jgi:hypothetical protein